MTLDSTLVKLVIVVSAVTSLVAEQVTLTVGCHVQTLPKDRL